MLKGRPPTGQAKPRGAAAKKRPAKAELSPPMAISLKAPAGLSKGLVVEWGHVVADLAAYGTVTQTDIDRVAVAFQCRLNAERIQDSYNAALSEGSANDIAKLQSAHASAIKTADGIIAGVERTVKIRPRKDEADKWDF